MPSADLTQQIAENVHEKDRLLYFEPNEIAGIQYRNANIHNGDIPSNVAWDMDELNMNVDLQVIVPSNDDCGMVNYHIIEKQSVGDIEMRSWVSFMQGDLQRNDKNYLTTDYTNISFTEIKENKVVSKEDLGITSIDINFDAHFYPIVTMKLVDVRGQSLLSPTELNFDYETTGTENSVESFFNALFRFPYPRFLLSVKGFYGSRITFTLAVDTFNSAFNAESGDFEVTIKFIGYVYGLYCDLPLDLIVASPYYNDTYWTQNDAFTYIDNGVSGARIMTYREFVEKLDTIGDRIDADSVMSVPNAGQYKTNKEELEAIKELEDMYGRYMGSMKCDNIVEGSVYTFYFFTDKSNGVTSNTQYYKKFKNSFDSYLKTYNRQQEYKAFMGKQGSEQSFNCITPFFETFEGVQAVDDMGVDKIYSQTGDYMEFTDDGGFKSFKPIEGGYTLKTVIDEAKDEKLLKKFTPNPDNVYGAGFTYKRNGSTLSKSQVDSTWFFVYEINKFTDFLKQKKTALEKAQDNLKKDMSNGMMDVYKDALGFKPTVDNMYRMLFAHIDCFMNYFYTGVSNIYKAKIEGRRKADKLGLTSDNSDIKYTSGNDAPPFPAYYIKNDKSLTREFPGKADNAELATIEEVAMVRNMCNSIETFRKELETLGANQNTNQIEKPVGEYLTIADLFKGSDTSIPWSNVNMSEKETQVIGNAGDIIYTLLAEYYINYCADSNTFKEEDNVRKWVAMQVDRYVKSKQGEERSMLALKDAGEKILNGTVDNLKWWQWCVGTWQCNKDENNRKCAVRVTRKKKREKFENRVEGRTFQDYRNVESAETSLDTKYQNLPSSITNPFVVTGGTGSFSNVAIFSVSKDEDSISASNKQKSILYNFTRQELSSIVNGMKSNGLCTMVNVAVTEEYKFNHLYYKTILDDYLQYHKVLAPEGDQVLGPTLNELNDGKSKGEVWFPFVIVGDENGKDVNNLFEKTFKEDMYKTVCKEDIYTFAYVLLTSIVKEANVENLVSVINTESGGIYTLNKALLLAIGAFLYGDENNINLIDVIKEEEKSNEDWSVKDVIIGYATTLFSGFWGQLYNLWTSTTSMIEWATNKIHSHTVIARLKTELMRYFMYWVDNDFSQVFESLVVDGTDPLVSKVKLNKASGANEIPVFEYDSEPEKWLRNLYTENTYVYIGQIDSYPETIKAPADVLNLIISQVGESLKKATANVTESTTSTPEPENPTNDTQESMQTSVYYLLKTLYNKWLSTYTVNDWKLHTVEDDLQRRKARFEQLQLNDSTNTEYNNFLYIDQFYNDISSTFIIDPETVAQVVRQYNTGSLSTYVYQFMQNLAQKNNLMLLALPVFNNLYDKRGIAEIFTPNNLYTPNNSGRGYGSTYVLMYTNEISKHSDYMGDKSYNFSRDYPDIAKVFDSNFPEDLDLFNTDTTGDRQNYKLAAFGVTFSKQNQMYFKGITVNTDNPQVTDESIKNLLSISDAAKEGDLKNPTLIGQNLFSIYSNRAYTCTVEMMGCMNIMPLMYFQLNNIPMFRGAYMIVNVKHSIAAGDVKTTFTGVRISKYLQPQVTAYAITDSLVNKLNNALTAGSTSYAPNVTIGESEMLMPITGVTNSTTSGRFAASNNWHWATVINGTNINPDNVQRGVVEDSLLGELFVPIRVDGADGVVSVWQSLRVNKNIMEPLRNVFTLIYCGKDVSKIEGYEKMVNTTTFPADAENNEYLIDGEHFRFRVKSVGGGKMAKINTYSFRSSLDKKGNPTGRLSSHSLGVALDINMSDNPYMDKNTYDSSVNINKKDTVYAMRTWNHPVVRAFLSQGFGWGIYSGSYDFMHFSYISDDYTNKNDNLGSGTAKQRLLLGR